MASLLTRIDHCQYPCAVAGLEAASTFSAVVVSPGFALIAHADGSVGATRRQRNSRRSGEVILEPKGLVVIDDTKTKTNMTRRMGGWKTASAW